MHICVIGQNGEIFYTKEKNNPWSIFFRVAELKGHTFSTNVECIEIDALICMGFHSEKVTSLLSRVPGSNSILINWEPEVVEPETYNPTYFSYFGKRFSPSIEWATKLEAEVFNWPQRKLNELEPFECWKSRQVRGVIVQANKFSAHRKALYKLRRKLIWNIGQKGNIILYGQGWEKSQLENLRMWVSSLRRMKYKNISLYVGGISRPPKNVFQGPAADKLEVMGRFQISLVIENSADYISEKLIESVAANCLSIYVGANLQPYGINLPERLLPMPTYSEIENSLQYLLDLSSEERYRLLEKQKEAINEYCDNSLNTKVLSKLAEDCVKFLEMNNS